MPVKKTATKRPANNATPRRVQTVKNLHTEQFDVGQPADIPLDNAINLVGGQAIEPIGEKALNADYLNELAFMEEPIEIMVQEDTNENAENPVQVGVNGAFVLFYRGVAMTVKRKFVDALIVKSSRVTTPEYFNPAGERSRAIRQTSALKFPFQVILDRNPKGAEWLRRRMADVI